MATMEKPKPKIKKRTRQKSETSEVCSVSSKATEDLLEEHTPIASAEGKVNIVVSEEGIASGVEKLILEVEQQIDVPQEQEHSAQVLEEILQSNVAKEQLSTIETTDVKSAEDISNDSVKDITKATEDCRELSNAISNIIQPLPASETSSVVNVTKETTNEQKVKTYQELAACHYDTIKADIKMLNEIQTPLVVFSMEDIETIFGTKEIEKAKKYAFEFEKNELQLPSPSNPLYEALTELQRARSKLVYNQRDIESLMTETTDRINAVWHLENCVERVGGRCTDGCYLEETHVYQVATLQKLFLVDIQKKLSLLREKATESHSQYSHLEHFLKYKIDDLLWMSSVSGTSSMRSSLRIIFWVMRTSGWGYDKTFRMQIRKWCCSLATKLLETDDSLENVLFLLHHILRTSRGIRWSFHLINCKIRNLGDIPKTLCVLEAIVYAGDMEVHDANSSQRKKKISEGFTDEYEVVVGTDAMDDNVWFVVDSDGEGADLESEGRSRGLLCETDVLGLLRQIPFEEIFKELMIVRYDGNEFVFCGGRLTGGGIVKILATLRMFLKTISRGLITYKSYREVSKELCRLALHCVKYFTDLWEVACINCEAHLLDRVLIEYNNLFLVSWNVIGCSGAKDTIAMFQSEMPFHLVLLETIEKVYKGISDSLVVSDNIDCYYAMVCISNMALIRSDEDFASTAIRRLYEIGFASSVSDLGCGEWARTLCGTALKSKPHLIGPLLAEASTPQQPQWLESLPLVNWKPHTGELIFLLNHFKKSAPNVIQHLLKGMNWSKNCLEYQTHRAVALFLIGMSRTIEQPKGQYPEWIWECILPLKLHMYDWTFDINSVPEPESITEFDPTGKSHASNVLLLVMTTWSHSIPQIFQNATPILFKLVNAGRFGEVIHALYYIIPILSERPDYISDCDYFRAVMLVIISNEKTYAKMATRLITNEVVGPVTKQLVVMIQSQLKHYAKFDCPTPKNLLMVWVHWLTSIEGWNADWVAIYLLDVALGSCFLHHDAISTAATHLAGCIQKSTVRSPTALSSGFPWFWNSNSYKGLVQCSVEAPYVWHATLWTEHSIMERGTGLWQRLVTKLATHKQGTKVNIDKTLKSVGCSDSSSILVLYRCAQYGSNMSVSHPIFTLIWQLFFYLYLDVSFLQFQDKKPIGSLFFEGMVNSRLLAKIRLKLLEAKTYHEEKLQEHINSTDLSHNVKDSRQLYHESQKNLMAAFISWLKDETISQYLEQTSSSQALPFYDKFSMLVNGKNTLWIDSVDFYQLSQFQPPVWPLPLIQMMNQRPNSVRLSETSLQSQPPSRGKSPDTDPSSRIVYRLKSYEKPLVESEQYRNLKLVPIVDPLIGNDFSKIFNMLHINLEEIERGAGKYSEVCKSLNSSDCNLYDMVHNLYEKRKINRSVMLGCGDHCKGKVQLNIQVTDWRRNGDVIRMMDYNRTMYTMGIDEATSPYDEIAYQTFIISKLTMMACDGKIVNLEENGPTMFNIVIEYLKDNILNFPTVHHNLISFATQLGERFVTQSGDQFVKLVYKIRGSDGVGLVGSLLKPCQLSTTDMVRVYSAISSTVTDYHVAFSYLSKFDIFKWLRSVRPNVKDRSTFLSLLFNSLGTSGFEPSEERFMLHELMCIQMVKVMAWEYPVHLKQVLTSLCSLSLEKKIPPDTWQHCITVIETYPNLLTKDLAYECLEMVGNQWWSNRGSWGPYGLYGQYGIYCTQMGRLGALLTSTVLRSAMLYNPPLLTKDICAIVVKAMQTFWNVWLCPWWGGGSQASVWVGELCRGPALMPWGPQDDVHPDTMLDAFTETILYCATTLPGSLNELLSQIWQWYSNNFPHPAVNAHILVRVHKALIKLPWTANSPHWLTWQDMRYLFKTVGLNIDSCNKFAVQCLGERPWVLWVRQLPEHSHSMAVQLLLPLLMRLNPSKEVLNDAENLPWELMSVEAYEENVNCFIRTLQVTTEPFSSNGLLLLLCAAGGLTERSQYGESWRNKRSIIVRSLVDVTCNDETPSVVEPVKFLLNKIQRTVESLENSSDSQKYNEATNLLNVAIPMLNMMKNTISIEKVWYDWFRLTSKACICAVTSCILQVTKRDVFANLTEEALSVYFEQEGDWSFIISNWRNECVVAVDFLLNTKSLLTAMATYKASDHNNKVHNSITIHPIDKAVLQSLYAIEIESSIEKSASLWVCYIVCIVGDNSLDRANTFAVINQAIAILEKWGQEPSWGLLKVMGLVQNKAPSHRFKLLVRFALCFTLNYQSKIKDTSQSLLNFDGNLFTKTVNIIEAMVNQKPCADIKHIIYKNLEALQNPDCTIKESLKHIVELCYDLYNETNYIKNINSLFGNIL